MTAVTGLGIDGQADVVHLYAYDCVYVHLC